MYTKGVILLAVIAGCWALPLEDEVDTSFFFNQFSSSERIVGGTQAAVGSHPHMVAMTTGLLFKSFGCGGSVISIRTVLTAAHCIDAVFSWGSLSSTLRLTVGTNRWNQGGTEYRVARNVTHPNYVSGIIKNDIGLFITTANIATTALVNPITLSFDYQPGGVLARVAGWGRIRANGALSANLLEIIVPTLGGQECVDAVAQAAADFNMRAPPVEAHLEICTFHAPNTGTCNGDSGSALARADTGVQIGVVSWGFPCARGAPDMFARVSAFENWIRANAV